MRGWLAALRIARREARRAKGRSALVLAMIALPVAALAFGAVNYDTFALNPTEKADRLMGTASAAVIWPFDGSIHQHPTNTDFESDVFVAAEPPEPPTVHQLLAHLPPGSRAIFDQHGTLSMRTATGTGRITARMLDYADPLARGILSPLSGRAPQSTDEVALTPAAVRRLGADIGGTVRLADGSRSFRVVGTVEDPMLLDAATIVLRPGAVPATELSTDRRDQQRWLVATPGPLTWTDVKQLNTYGIVAVSRYVLAHPPDPAEVDYLSNESGGSALALAVLVGGLAMLEIILLAGPAFAVSARRRRRELALVAATGASPAQLRRIVLADGVVLGAAAAVLGVALGVLAGVATRPVFENLANQRSGALRVFPVALAALAGLAVVTGLLAAVIPAWISARQDVVTALAGRRGITRSRKRWVVVAAVLGITGTVTAAVGAWRVNAKVILSGLVVVELALILGTPALVGLVARLGRWLPLAPRIALRDTSRNRTAAAPAISAVMAAVVGTLALAVVGQAISGREEASRHSAFSRPGDVYLFPGGSKGVQTNEPPPADVIDTLRSTLPVTAVYQVNGLTCATEICAATVRPPAGRECPYSDNVLDRDPTPAEQRAASRDARCAGRGLRYRYLGGINSDVGMTFVIDAADVGAVLNLSAEDAGRVAEGLRGGAVFVGNPDDVQDGQVNVFIKTGGFDRGDPVSTRTVTAPGFALPRQLEAPIAIMTPATAGSLGLRPRYMITLATTSRVPTQAELDRAQAAFGGEYYVNVEYPGSLTELLVVLAIVAGVITLTAAAIATGLAAADGRADLGTLAAVGASPGVRRVLSLSQSGVIAGLGSLLGTAAGLGASVAVLFALNQRFRDIWPTPLAYPIKVPWLNVGIALVAVPLVAMLGAGLLTRSRLPIERRL